MSSPPPAIQATDLHKTYTSGEGPVTAVDGVSLTVDHGEVVGVLGPNGAGKTTLIKLLLGLVTPDAGAVEICGIDVADAPAAAHEHVDAMLEGDRNVYWRLTVRENLEFFAGLGGQPPAAMRERHDRLLERFSLTEWDDAVVNDLSTGMKQKVSLASTLARDVDVVFLDEPTLGLDVETALELQTELRRLAAEEDVAIVLTSHDMDVIEAVADRVVIVQDGQVIADDETAALVEVLETRAFEVTIATPVADSVTRRLRALGFTVETDADRLRLSSEGADSQAVYDLMRLLDETDQELRGIESESPDLEAIFLELTDTEVAA